MKGLIFLLCGLMVCAMGAAVWGIEGDVELLRIVADGYDENMSRLRTWGGTVEVEYRSYTDRDDIDPNILAFPLRTEINLHGGFLIDRDAAITRWFNSIEENRVSDGVEEQHSRRYAGMIQADVDYQMFNILDNAGFVRTLEIWGKDRDVMSVFCYSIFSPLYMWENISQHNNYFCSVLSSEMLRRVYEEAEERERCSVVRDGDLVTFELWSHRDDPCEEVVNRFVYDLSKGYNMVEMVTSSPYGGLHLQADYVQVGDVFVLCEITKNYTNSVGGVDQEMFFHACWETGMVNEVVDPCEFGFDKIGLRIGDSVTDRRTGEFLYNWQGNSDFSGMSSEPVQRCVDGESAGGGGGGCCGRRISCVQQDPCDPCRP
ncbi:MAG: hypothetical protein JW936_04725 [Sedimentisphaerales bacterium]|nr:hypothetical protein [Sedimentisphaerales bacterium]